MIGGLTADSSSLSLPYLHCNTYYALQSTVSTAYVHTINNTVKLHAGAQSSAGRNFFLSPTPAAVYSQLTGTKAMSTYLSTRTFLCEQACCLTVNNVTLPVMSRMVRTYDARRYSL